MVFQHPARNKLTKYRAEDNLNSDSWTHGLNLLRSLTYSRNFWNTILVVRKSVIGGKTISSPLTGEGQACPVPCPVLRHGIDTEARVNRIRPVVFASEAKQSVLFIVFARSAATWQSHPNCHRERSEPQP